jgi:hypothetical protein
MMMMMVMLVMMMTTITSNGKALCYKQTAQGQKQFFKKIYKD